MFGGNNTNQQQQPVFTNQQVQANSASTLGATNSNNQQRNVSLFSNNQSVNGNNGFVSGQVGQSGSNMHNSAANQPNLFTDPLPTFGGSQNTSAQVPNGGGGLFGSAPSHGVSLFAPSPPIHGSFGNGNLFAGNPNDLQVFQMFPSETELSKLKEQQLTSISNLKIWNNYGEIHFLEPVSIQDINFQEILIMPNKIEVLSENLSKKKRQYLYHHYLNYMFLSQNKRVAIRRAIQLQTKQKGMNLISMSEVNGDLLVQL